MIHFISLPIVFKAVLGGIPLTVIVAILIQYLYNTYYIEPLKERTFLNYTTLSLDRVSYSDFNSSYDAFYDMIKTM